MRIRLACILSLIFALPAERWAAGLHDCLLAHSVGVNGAAGIHLGKLSFCRRPCRRRDFEFYVHAIPVLIFAHGLEYELS